MLVEDYFKNKDNVYYGHGTGRIGGGVEDKILANGLRCKNNIPSIYYTSICLGEGADDLYNKNAELLNNWPHTDSSEIIIACMPKNLTFNPFTLIGMALEQYRESAFCYSVPQENGKLNYYLKPEFIRGYYSAATKTFTENDRYYENLPKEEQDQLMQETKQTYIDILVEQSRNGMMPFSSFAECQQVVAEEYGEEWKSPFSEEEVADIDVRILEELKKNGLSEKKFDEEELCYSSNKPIDVWNSQDDGGASFEEGW